MWSIISGGFLGWALGANDAANLFGPAVTSRSLRFWTAAGLASLFVMVGAVLKGAGGFETYSAITEQSLLAGFTIMLAAAGTVALMTLIGLPVSSTQATVGAIIGGGLIAGEINIGPLAKIFLSWVLTPLGGLIFAYVPYRIAHFGAHSLLERFSTHERLIRVGLILVTCYGAYSLGANNVANVTGVYVNAGLLSIRSAALIGSGAIAVGILTFSRNVIRTVGGRLVQLDPLAALIVVLAEAITLNVYANLGVPVSASQAVVGAVLGIGLVKGVKTIDSRVLLRVLFGWLGTPAIAGVGSIGLGLLVHAIM
jgi:PiT family inorganic phosphate transporter